MVLVMFTSTRQIIDESFFEFNNFFKYSDYRFRSQNVFIFAIKLIVVIPVIKSYLSLVCNYFSRVNIPMI